jgi:hypothetical protein
MGDWLPSVLFTLIISVSGTILFQTVERNCIDSL